MLVRRISYQEDRETVSSKRLPVIVIMMMTVVVRQPEDALAKGKSMQYPRNSCDLL
jgi:hypothetical protein